ncbi:MAG: helix-turn-helix transcriptional regulator [Vagococcus sp.]
MTIGQKIAYLREKQRLSQPQLAKALNVATSTIGMWETGKRGLKDESIILIANYFNVSADYLLGIDIKNSYKSNEIIANITDDVTEEELQDILTYIEFIKNKHRT